MRLGASHVKRLAPSRPARSLGAGDLRSTGRVSVAMLFRGGCALHSLADAEVASQSFLRWTSLDGHDSPPWEIGCARWTWQDDPEIRRGVLVFDLPVSSVGTKWSWVKIGSPYLQPAIAFRGGETGRARDLNGCHELSHIVREILGIRIACCEERWCNRFAVATLAGDAPGVEWEGAGEADAAAGTKSAATAIAMCTWENGH